MARPLVFIDTETTGTDPARHELVEVAWAVEGKPVRSLILPHSFSNPDPYALRVNGYLDRELDDRSRWATTVDINDMFDDLKGATLVGANPRFDAAFLATLGRGEPWHYRLLDVQAYGMAALGLYEMPGLADLVTHLTGLGYEIPKSDHTAANDVLATRAVWRALFRTAVPA